MSVLAPIRSFLSCLLYCCCCVVSVVDVVVQTGPVCVQKVYSYGATWGLGVDEYIVAKYRIQHVDQTSRQTTKQVESEKLELGKYLKCASNS